MLVDKILSIIANVIAAILSFLPNVTALPSIGGYDIDSALVSGVAQAYDFANAVWVVKDVLLGATVIWGYYALKMFVRLILGHRAPGTH